MKKALRRSNRKGFYYKRGAIAAFSPLSLAPFAWLRFDDYGLADDALIQTATDLSGNGNHWTQATEAQRPTNKVNVVNGYAVARFDGADDGVSGPDLSGLTAGEIFLVVKNDNDPPAIGTGGLWQFGTGMGTHYPFADGVVYDSFGSDTRKTTGDPVLSLAAWRLYNVVSVSGEWTSRIDGTQHFTTGTNTVGFHSTTSLGSSGDGNFFHDGDIAEMILFDRELAVGERAQVNTYIGHRYALTIA